MPVFIGCIYYIPKIRKCQYPFQNNSVFSERKRENMFSDILNKLLTERGINTLQLAKEINAPKSLVYEWKNGQREPSVANMVKLADYFGVPLEYLAGREPVPDDSEKELIVMLRAARNISKEDHDELIDSFKKNLDAYLQSKSENDK